MIHFVSEELQYSFVHKERTHKSKTGGYVCICIVQPGKEEGAERTGQVSL